MSAEMTHQRPWGPTLYERSSLVAEAWSEARGALRYAGLVRFLVSAAFAKDRRTVFGIFWRVLDPVLLMLVYIVLIDFIRRSGVGSSTRLSDYPLFVLTAITAWKFFASTVGRAMGQLVGRERLMRTVAFPVSTLIYSVAIVETIQFAIGLCVVLAFAAGWGIYPSFALLGIVPVVVLQLFVTLGFSFFFSALNVFFRDSQLLTSYLFRLLFYLSPALYPVPHLSPLLARAYKLNPFATLLPQYRQIIIERQLPDLHALALVTPGAILILLVGYLFFVHLAPQFNKVT